MSTETIVSIVIVVVVLALIGGLIAISYAVKKASEKHGQTSPAEEPVPEEEAAAPAEAEAEEPAPAEEAPAEEPAPAEEAPAEEPAPAEEAKEEVAAAAAPASQDIAGEQLIVKNMSVAMRDALGVVGPEYDNDVYSVRYSYSFKARLVLSSEETRNYYAEIVSEIGSYKKMKLRSSRRQQIVSVGRKKVAVLLFKGKKLCLALALDPKVYEGTKYRGKDVSEMKRFESTPMLFRVSTERKVKYAKVLLNRLALENELEQGAPSAKDAQVPELTRDELIAAKEIKVTGKKVEA